MTAPNEKTVLAHYNELVAQGILSDDEIQRQTATALDGLQARLTKHTPARRLKNFFANQKNTRPRGLYIYGGVGCGKSMLMDLFFANLPIKAKRRTHFHAFMQEMHALIYAYRQKVKTKTKIGTAPRHGFLWLMRFLHKFMHPQTSDPIPPIAAQLAKQTRVLCFDELAVKDIADASILGRLFTELFARGVVVVATSNHAPDELYAGGLNRYRFLPFIALLKRHMDIICLAGTQDYRLARLIGHPVWFYPLTEKARQNMDDSFTRLTGGAPVQAAQLTVKARILSIPQQAQGVARLSFDALCAADLGVGDYLALAAQYHTLLIDAIPHFDEARRNQALRFVHLIDTLYEHRVKLIASANVPAQALFADNVLVQERARTLSRLAEMQAKDYLAAAHGL